MNIAGSTRVIFLPCYKGNPYQMQLAKALRCFKVEVLQPTINFLWLKRVKQLNCQMIHFHWLDNYWSAKGRFSTLVKTIYFLWQLRAASRSGIRMVWTCHNLANHSGRFKSWERWVVRKAVNYFDKVIVHNSADIHSVCEYFGLSLGEVDKFAVIRHASFGEVYPDLPLSSKYRNQLKIESDSHVFLMFGVIRQNKGIELLLEAVKGLGDSNVVLLIAGKGPGTYVRQITSIAAQDSRVRLISEFIPDDQVRALHELANVVILPYGASLTSGALILAMESGKPVISTKFPGACHLLAGGEGGVLVDQTIDGLREGILQLLQVEIEWPSMGKRNRNRVTEQSWHSMASQTARCYEG